MLVALSRGRDRSLAALAQGIRTGRAAPSPRRSRRGELPSEIRNSLFDARSELLLDGSTEVGAIARADERASRPARARACAPTRRRSLRDAARRARRRRRGGRRRGRGRARRRLRAQPSRRCRSGAYDVTTAAAGRGDVERARAWLLIRDFRQATRFTRPGVDATTALDALEAGELSARRRGRSRSARTCSTPTSRACVDYLDEAANRERARLPARGRRVDSRIAAGYWTMLAPEYEEQRGAAARERGRPRRSRRCRTHRRRPAGLPAAVAEAEAPAQPLHRRPVHARGAGAAGAAVHPLPRPDPARVRPRRLRDRGHDPVRDHRGRSPSPRPRPRRSATSPPSSRRSIPRR